MSRLVLAAGVAAWLGATLLLSLLRPVRRVPLLDRLAPHAPASGAGVARATTADTFRAALAPLATELGGRLAAVVGVHESLAVRLERVHAPIDPTTFRVRQLGVALLAVGAAGPLALLAPLPAPVGVLLLLGVPCLAFLVVEQRLARESQRWQQQVFDELPVISEQLGMLLGAGWSLGAALHHVARRASGACSRDLARACRRVEHGLSEEDALREWARTVQVPAVERLVAVLALRRDATDLGRLVSDEARAVRREAHRHLLEAIERRTQQVWIPVTVAALVPGVLLLAVPFVHALQLFTGR